MFRPLLVGESNPYGDPGFALYHLPRSASGNHLRQIMGLKDHEYERIDKVNLIEGTRWSAPKARLAAEKLLRSRPPGPFVLLGSRVHAAFGVPKQPSGERLWAFPHETGRQLVLLPHPSKRNRVWNEPDIYSMCRRALEGAGVLPLRAGAAE